MNRHITYFVNDFKPIEFCGKTIGFQADNVSCFELPFEIKATEGEHDFNKCDNCKNTLNEIKNRLKIKFEGIELNRKAFPFCCPSHSNLVNIKKFNRDSFINVPEIVAKKVIYTNQHIINNYNAENWYKKTTDYIEWAFNSFGQMPVNCGEPLYLSDYFFYVTNLLENNKEIPTDKKDSILKYIKNIQIPNKTHKTDLNLLINIYQKWFNIFPFELSFFQNLKQYFESVFPKLINPIEVNMYSGIAKAKILTKSQLINKLLNTTDHILTQINTATLYEKGLLTDSNKIKLELIIESRKFKLKQGYINKSSDEEQRYRKILKEWFNDEKKFIDEVTPFIKNIPFQNELNLTIIQFALYYYYLQETKYEKHFGKEKGKMKEIETLCNKYGFKSIKNFQISYNKISNNSKERITSKNIDNIKAVIKHLTQFPNALKLAEDELKLSEIN
jgi:hypothetical protein